MDILARGMAVSARGYTESFFVDGPTSDNKFDITKLSSGYLVANGAVIADSNYVTSEYIPISNGDIVRYFFDSSMGSNNNVYIFGQNKEYVASISGTATDTSIELTSHRTATINNAAAKYIRISFAVYKLNMAMIVINTGYPNSFQPYKAEKYMSDTYSLNNTQRAEIQKSFIANPLSGKIVSFNGDSISTGAGYAGGYGEIIALRNGMIYENISVGGATIASGTMNGSAIRHWVSQTIGNMRADADYIILEGGVNDKSLTTPVTLGTMTNSMTNTFDHTTFIGAMEYMFSKAVERFPGKKIGYILVHRLWALNDVFETQWYPAIVNVCRKWGIPLCDLYKNIPSLNLIPALKASYTLDSDGWHPNEQGYRLFYVDKIEFWMRSL